MYIHLVEGQCAQILTDPDIRYSLGTDGYQGEQRVLHTMNLFNNAKSPRCIRQRQSLTSFPF